jgi:hypothetical protein
MIKIRSLRVKNIHVVITRSTYSAMNFKKEFKKGHVAYIFFKGWFAYVEPLFISGVHTNTVMKQCKVCKTSGRRFATQAENSGVHFVNCTPGHTITLPPRHFQLLS